MQAIYVQRLRLIFRKEGAARYISHLDLARALERALNRANMPVTYSQGFNRRPKLAMATALPLGYTSEYELADIWLNEKMEPAQAQAQIMSRMAPGIDVYQVSDVPISGPSLQALTTESTYIATPLDPIDVAELEQKIAAILAAPTLPRVREQKNKRKEYDLRPLILDLSVSETAVSTPTITMRLCLEPAKTGRPDEVLLALDLDALAAHIHRTHIGLAQA
ncbi:MAG: TIGR03936 family radical SAM-associated protein [Chloroflexota bacterium]